MLKLNQNYSIGGIITKEDLNTSHVKVKLNPSYSPMVYTKFKYISC